MGVEGEDLKTLGLGRVRDELDGRWSRRPMRDGLGEFQSTGVFRFVGPAGEYTAVLNEEALW